MCLFCRALIFQIYLNYFLPKIIDIPTTPCAMTRLPACPRRRDIYAFFCRALIFQFCLNFFFPKLSSYPHACDPPRQRIICSFPTMPFLPSADISILFELFFTQNYRHTPAYDPPHQSIICSFPTMPFLPSTDISNLFELFFPKIIHIPPVPCAMPRLLYVPGAPTYVQILRFVCRDRGLIAPTMILYVWKALTK